MGTGKVFLINAYNTYDINFPVDCRKLKAVPHQFLFSTFTKKIQCNVKKCQYSRQKKKKLLSDDLQDAKKPRSEMKRYPKEERELKEEGTKGKEGPNRNKERRDQTED